jgi:hypothetical protein
MQSLPAAAAGQGGFYQAYSGLNCSKDCRQAAQ